MVTDLTPIRAASTKLPICPTLRFTVSPPAGAFAVELTVKPAAVPSITAAPGATLIVGPLASSSAMVKLAEPEPEAPPPRLVPEDASREPSATAMVSPASSTASEVARIRSVAVAEEDAPPVKVMPGVAVVRF